MSLPPTAHLLVQQAPPPVWTPIPQEVLRSQPLGPWQPRFLERYWPLPGYPARLATLLAIVVAALVGGVTFVLNRPGLDWLLCGLAVAGCALVTRVLRPADPAATEPRDRLASAGWAVASVALLGVTVLRSNGWLGAYCLLAALACGSLALAGGRTTKALFAGATAVLLAPAHGAPWLRDGVLRLRGRSGGGTRIGLTVFITAALLLVFGALLLSADVAFRQVLGALVPSTGPGRPAAFAVTLVLAAAATVLAARRPRLSTMRPAAARRARVAEWAVPLAALDLLFLAFVLVQLAVLFGGDEQVLRADGPTYANYARSGFWQLLVVTLLTLAVLGVALRVAPRAGRLDRVLLRVLLGGLSLLTLVIVASAVKRLGLYEQAYGYTRLRVLVEVVELWLGLLFVLVLAALVSLRTGWVPRVVVASAVLVLLGVGVADPDRFVAERNVSRYQQTGRIDVDYLARLSPDAVPALICLPPQVRPGALADIADRLARDDDWRTWNYGRAHARALLADPAAGCD